MVKTYWDMVWVGVLLDAVSLTSDEIGPGRRAKSPPAHQPSIIPAQAMARLGGFAIEPSDTAGRHQARNGSRGAPTAQRNPSPQGGSLSLAG
jgi:hypothetical protein